MRVIPKLLSIRISRIVGIKKLSSCFPFHWPWSPEWSHLSPPTLFFCKNIYQLLLSDGVVIIDDAGITRHVMTTSLDSKELATTVFSLVPVLKKQKVSAERISDAVVFQEVNLPVCHWKLTVNMKFIGSRKVQLCQFSSVQSTQQRVLHLLMNLVCMCIVDFILY